MKSFKKFIAEVAQPKPEEEKRFKDQHEVDTMDHPVSTEFQHKGVVKPKAKRKADQEGDANYDKAYVMKQESVQEGILGALAGAGIAHAAGAGIAGKVAGAVAGHAVQKALSGKKKDEELSPKQKKIDHNKNGKIDGHDLAMLRAKKKNEEVEEIDELSQETLRQYHGKAGADLQKKREKLNKGTLTTKDHKQGQNRVTGLNRAANKMHEEVELTEAMFKKGPVRLKDGKQIMVSKEDADLLNKMFKDLSANNRKKMSEVAMSDKNGFEEILGFAREAL